MRKFITTLLVGLVGINSALLAENSRPKLVVGIVVDQLRADYIKYLEHLFGTQGFKRLSKDAVIFNDVDFRTAGLDAANSTAIIYTGAWPAVNGLPSATYWDPAIGQAGFPLADSNVIGNFTSDTFSPTNLRVSTLADEIAIDGIGLSQIYSISTDPQQAVTMSGHCGTSAVWLDQTTGKWATSSYYKDIPPLVSRRNYAKSVTQRVDTAVWRPMLPLNLYPGVPAQKRHYEFRHTFSKSDKDVYHKFATSPKINEEITDIAIEYLQQLQLGKRDVTDMLNVGYTLAPFKYVGDGDFRLELADSYVRFDHQLGRLLSAIDNSVGMSNAVVYLTSTGYFDDSTPIDEKYKIPSGEFSSKRAISLLNSFLSATFGNGDYIDGFYGNQIWLKKKYIESRNLDLIKVRNEATAFIKRMSGVAHAVPLHEAIGGVTPETENLRHSLDPGKSGDIIITFAPGWTIITDHIQPITKQYVRGQAALTPAYIIAPGLQPEKIVEPVDASRFSPTISSIIHIRAPNGSNAKPLLFGSKL